MSLLDADTLKAGDGMKEYIVEVSSPAQVARQQVPW